MDKIIPNKREIPENKLCEKCQESLATAAVKCGQCDCLFHLDCTGMPDYMAIKYYTSRVLYTCENCVKSGSDNYQQLTDWIENNRHTKGQSVNNINNDEYGKQNQQLHDITTAIAELRSEVASLTRKTEAENGDKQKQQSKMMKEGTTYAGATAKTNGEHHAVLLKPKDNTGPPNKEEIISVLKQVPTVSMKTTQQKTVKLVFPTEKAKEQALGALKTMDQIENTHHITSEKKLQPKVQVVFIPDFIQDEHIIQSILEKNEQIDELMEQETDMKLLFTKSSKPGFKTAFLSVSPSIRKAMENNNNRVYLHLSRCKIYDHYWVQRCGKCMKYGHKTANCYAVEPVCGHCAQNHWSNKCTNKEQLKCHHCTVNNREETRHSAFNTNCPTFIQAKHNIIRRTKQCSEGETMAKN